MNGRRILTLAITLGATVQLRAQQQARGPMLAENVKHSLGDMWGVWTSPAHAQPRDLLAGSAWVATAALISPIDQHIDRWAYDHRDDAVFKVLAPLRAGGALYSGKTITPIVLGLLAASVVARDRSMQQGLLGCAASYGASSVLRSYVIYPLVQRERPEPRDPAGPAPPASDGDQYHFGFPGSNDWGMHALPGGHIANIAACTTYLTQRYRMGFAEPVLWALVGGIGVSRTLDRAHWMSDEILGVGLGYGTGREVALRDLRRSRHATTAPAASASADGAFFSAGPQGFRVGWQRQF